MELNTRKKTEQPLLKRTEAIFTTATDGATPSRIALAQAIGKKEKGTVVVTHVYPETGSQQIVVYARIYHDEKVAEALERKNLLAKQKPKSEPAEAA